mgnify:FL=1
MLNDHTLAQWADRAVACPSWKYISGMKVLDPVSGKVFRKLPFAWVNEADHSTAGPSRNIAKFRPDFSDPLTVLGVLHLARVALNSPGLCTDNLGTLWAVLLDGDYTVCHGTPNCCVAGSCVDPCMSTTEVGALVMAIESADRTG